MKAIASRPTPSRRRTAGAAGETLAPPVLTQLTRRDDAAGLYQLLTHLLALFVTGALVLLAGSAGLRFTAVVLHGLLLVFLFAPLHESIHHTAFESRALNRAVAALCGFVLLLPPRYFRIFHLAHHRHTAHPDRDPERIGGPPRGVAGHAWRISGMGYWVERVSSLLRHARGVFREPFVAAAQRAALCREARLYLAAYAAVATVSLVTGWTHALWLWIVPVLLGQPWLRLFLLAEHTGCDDSPDMLRNSRTTVTNRLMAWLCWNMCYHAEHHAYAAIPFHRLPDAHLLLRARIRHTQRGYCAVHRALWRAGASVRQ